MRGVVRRAAEMFRRRSGESPASRVGPAVVDGRVELDGADFALVERVDEFMAAVATERRVALRLPTSRYEQVYHRELRAGFESKHAEGSAEFKGFYYAQLFCGGCGREFPGSFTMSLIGGLDAFSSVSGATPGFAEFGRTGRCTRCASTTSLLAYECFPSAEIGEDDAAALRQYWRDSAIRWWSETGRRKGVCDVCSTSGLTTDDSYLVSGGTYLICSVCVDKRLADAVDRLRANPYHFGASELRRARRNRR
jgi:hypothetical protein